MSRNHDYVLNQLKSDEQAAFVHKHERDEVLTMAGIPWPACVSAKMVKEADGTVHYVEFAMKLLS